MKYDLLIFDFDGTIVDSKPGIIFALMETCKHYNIPLLSEAEVVKCIGLPIFKFLKSIGIRDDNLIEARETYRKIYAENVYKMTILFSGVKEVLETLKNNKIHLTIASNKGRNGLLALLDYFNISKYFSFIVSEGDVVNKKPAPDMGLLILNNFNTNRERVLVIGDTIFDIKMANVLSVDSCFALYGYGELEGVHPDECPTYKIEKFSDILYCCSSI